MEKPHKRLKAWQRSMDLVEEVYKATATFPKDEIYGLTSQMRRAVVSIPSNISEGAADRSADQFRNNLAIALGSLNELQTQIEIAKRLGYLNVEVYIRISNLADECAGLVYGLKKSIH